MQAPAATPGALCGCWQRALRGRLACGRYKQRGAPAVEADNVFHHLTYGDVDVAAIADVRERAALEAQVHRRCRDVCHVQL